MYFFILFLLFCITSHTYADWDSQYWQGLKWTQWKSGRHKLYLLAQTRLTHDWKRFTYYRASQCYAYKLLDDLDLEVHYSYINSKSPTALRFAYTHRLELEANPSFTLNNGIKINWRNRLELIKEQHRLHIIFVLRERLGIVFPVDCGKLKSVSMLDEVFYNLSLKKFTQNRFFPALFTFALSKHTSLDVYVMIRNHFSSTKWFRELVLGSEISF